MQANLLLIGLSYPFGQASWRDGLGFSDFSYSNLTFTIIIILASGMKSSSLSQSRFKCVENAFARGICVKGPSRAILALPTSSKNTDDASSLCVSILVL